MSIRDEPWILVKFGQEEHIRSFQNSLVYMNTIEYFKRVENQQQRDIHEGTDVWLNPSTSDLLVDGYKLTQEGGTLSVALSTSHCDIKVFCACLICKGDIVRDDFKILDDRVCDFGDTFIVIHRWREFTDRLRRSLERELASERIGAYQFEKVQYVDIDTFDGNYGPLRKPQQYEYQQEWRLAVKANDEEAYKFHIPSISDISHIEKTKNFKNRIEKKDDGSGYNLIFS